MAKVNENDEHEVDLEAEMDPKEIVQKARGTFSVSNRLKNIKLGHAQLTLFTDTDAVGKYRKINTELQVLNDAASKVNLKLVGGADQQKRLVDSYTAKEPELDAAREEMLAGALVVKLHAWPGKVAKAARGKARRKFHSDIHQGVPPEKASEAANYVDMLLLGQTIVEIVNSDGEVDSLAPYVDGSKPVKKGKKPVMIDPRDTIGTQLEDDLPPSQWKRLYDAYQTLTLTDQIGEAATEDPGF